MDSFMLDTIKKLNELDSPEDDEIQKIIDLLCCRIFPFVTYRLDGIVDKILGLPVIGITCYRNNECYSILVTLVYMEYQGTEMNSKKLEQVKKETSVLADAESCLGAVLTVWKTIDREILSPKEKVDALVNEYTTFDYTLTFC